MSSLGAKHRHSAPRNVPAESTSSAQTAFVAALDRLLEPLESLQEERFQSGPERAAAGPGLDGSPEPVESVQAENLQAENLQDGSSWPARTTLADGKPRLRHGRISWWFRLLRARVRCSQRSPYRQLRAVLWFGAIGLFAFALLWLIDPH